MICDDDVESDQASELIICIDCAKKHTHLTSNFDMFV